MSTVFGWAIFLVVFTGVVLGFDAFILFNLWDWFAVPILGWPELTFRGAVGVSILIGWFTHSPLRHAMWDAISEDLDPVEQASSLFKSSFALPLFMLFVGWLVHELYPVVPA